jgi:hypothetical protein
MHRDGCVQLALRVAAWRLVARSRIYSVAERQLQLLLREFIREWEGEVLKNDLKRGGSRAAPPWHAESQAQYRGSLTGQSHRAARKDAARAPASTMGECCTHAVGSPHRRSRRPRRGIGDFAAAARRGHRGGGILPRMLALCQPRSCLTLHAVRVALKAWERPATLRRSQGSEIIFQQLRSTVGEFLGSDRYEASYQRFEILLAMAVSHRFKHPVPRRVERDEMFDEGEPRRMHQELDSLKDG